jgi:hypothetical protein
MLVEAVVGSVDATARALLKVKALNEVEIREETGLTATLLSHPRTLAV